MVIISFESFHCDY